MNEKSRNIAIAGLACGLNVVMMVLATYIRVNTGAFLFLCALLTAIILLEVNVKYAATGFVATVLLATLLVPDKQTVALYALFFGWYPLLKLFAETRKSRWIEWLAKLIGFHLALGIGGILFYSLFHINILTLQIPIWLLWPALVIVFVLMDILLSLGIHFYLRKRNKQR
ncbi:MAG: hypothetical protein HFI90_05005 [Clostridia bacterium]|nr:hypothetical protein [Clostridia bacterium]